MLFLIDVDHTQPIPTLHKKPVVNMAFVDDKNKTNIIKPIVQDILHTGRLIESYKNDGMRGDVPDSVAACTAISNIISHLADYKMDRAKSFIKDVAFKVGYDMLERSCEQKDLDIFDQERIANLAPLEPGKLSRSNTRVTVGGNVRRGDKVIIHTLNPHTGSSDERAAAVGKLKHKLDVGDVATVSSRKKNGWLRVKIHRTEAVITIRNITSCSRVLWG